MSHASRPPLRPRRSMALALLATTAAAALLGGCNQTDKLFSRSSFSSDEVQLSASEAAGATSQWAAAYANTPSLKA